MSSGPDELKELAERVASLERRLASVEEWPAQFREGLRRAMANDSVDEVGPHDAAPGTS